MTGITNMKELIERLKQLRSDKEFEEQVVGYCQAELEKTNEFALLKESKDKLASIQAELAQVDEQIREAALLEYAKNGNKKPFSGVSVVINIKLKYNVDKAIMWCMEIKPDWLKLDTRQFDKHAKAVSDTMPLEFVNVVEEPSVRIAKEL